MLFNSYEFIMLFLPLTVAGFYLIGRSGARRAATAWLVAASLFFYGWWNPTYLLLLGASVVFNFTLGGHLVRSRSARSPRRRALLVVGIALNLSSIGFFKYANFFVDNVNLLTDTNYHLGTIILPLAISFFTFQQITYLVDSYKGLTEEHSFLNYCLFVTFFPQLIAGPIVHHSEMLPQFARRGAVRLRSSDLAVGITLFSIGLFKKAVLADGIAAHATPVFAAAESGMTMDFLTAWGGALSYTFQLYFDFSGYSDMALGGARLFGIRLPANFNSPYQATSIIDFWHRWHMTLSRFLRDYVYFPLGGNRRGRARRHANLLLTMLIGGLWHGAGWTFIAWGGLHGIYLMVNHAWRWLTRRTRHADSASSTWWGRRLAQLLTLLAVIVGWVFFRAASFDGAMRILDGMAGLNGVSLPAAVSYRLGSLAHFLASVGVTFVPGGGKLFLQTWSWIAALGFVSLMLPNALVLLRRYRPTYDRVEALSGADALRPCGPLATLCWRPDTRWALTVGSLLAAGVLALSQVSEFLYYQF